MAKTASRLQIAQHIHQVLAREIGHAIEIEQLLANDRYARDVLLVCDALAGTDAPGLAERFRQLLAPPAALPAAAPGHALQPTDWSRDTSGFGVTQPPADEAPTAPAPDEAASPHSGPERRRNWLPRWRD